MNDKTYIFGLIFNALVKPEDEEKIIADKIFKAIDITDGIIKQLYPNNPEKEIYCNDILVLSINQGTPMKYYLTDNTIRSDKFEFPDGHIERPMNGEFINIYSPLGQVINGRNVGDHCLYIDENENEFWIDIIDHRRTAKSYKISNAEIKASLAYDEQQRNKK